MSTLVRKVLMEMGFKDTGFAAGLQTSTGAIARFTAQVAGLTGGGVSLALAMNHAVREIGEMQLSMLRLRLAVGGNVDEFRELQAIVQSSPRGLLFDDNDVARALSLAKTLDMTNDEIRLLLPSIRGMAAAMNEDLGQSLQAVAIALETGQVRGLRQYGISIADVDRKARAFYGAESKDLDETARRWAVLNAVLDKSKLFESAEMEALRTLPGALRAIKTEIGEMIEEFATPAAAKMSELLTKLGDVMRQRSAEGALRDAKELIELSRSLPGFAAEEAMARARAIAATLPYAQQLRLPGDVTGLGQFALGVPIEVAGTRGGAAQGGRVPDQAAAARERALRARMLAMGAFTFEPQGEYGELLAGENKSEGARSRARLAEERLRDLERQGEEERDLRNRLAAEQSHMEEEIWRESWARRIDAAQGLAAGLYSVVSRASMAYFQQERGRHMTLIQYAKAAAKQEAGQYIIGLGLRAAKTAALYAIEAYAASTSFMTAWAVPGKLAAAAKYAAFATAAGVAGAALASQGAAEFSRGDEVSTASERGRSSDRGQRRAFGYSMTRPIENLTVNVAVTFAGGPNFFGTGHERSVAEMMEQYGLPAIQDAARDGKLAA